VFTSREWRGEIRERPIDDCGKLLRLSVITTVLIYLQVVFGVVLRHTGERLDAHLLFAVLVIIHTILLLSRVKRSHSTEHKTARLANFLGVLLLVQLLLGAASYFGKYTAIWRIGADAVVYITTIHLAVGALMLVTSLMLTLRVLRLTRLTELSTAGGLLREQASL
jgi:heme A synthase